MINSSILAPQAIPGQLPNVAQLTKAALLFKQAEPELHLPPVYALINTQEKANSLSEQVDKIERIAWRIDSLKQQSAWHALACRSKEFVDSVNVFQKKARNAGRLLGGNSAGVRALRRIRTQTARVGEILGNLEDLFGQLAFPLEGAHAEYLWSGATAGQQQISALCDKLDTLFEQLSDRIASYSKALAGIADRNADAKRKELADRFDNLISRALVIEVKIREDDPTDEIHERLDIFRDRLSDTMRDLSACMKVPRNRGAYQLLLDHHVCIMSEQVSDWRKSWRRLSRQSLEVQASFAKIEQLLSQGLG